MLAIGATIDRLGRTPNKNDGTRPFALRAAYRLDCGRIDDDAEHPHNGPFNCPEVGFIPSGLPEFVHVQRETGERGFMPPATIQAFADCIFNPQHRSPPRESAARRGRTLRQPGRDSNPATDDANTVPSRIGRFERDRFPGVDAANVGCEPFRWFRLFDDRAKSETHALGQNQVIHKTADKDDLR